MGGHDTNQLTIAVSRGFGTGRTLLSAYDRALFEAGIGNYNLIYLSSVIPPGSQVIEKQVEPSPEQWGHVLYTVVAEYRSLVPHEQAWAGIGWLQDARTGAGLFVEHHGTSESQVLEDIHASLQDMRAYREDTFGGVEYVTIGGTCIDQPVCAVVAAVYQSEGWRRHQS